MKSILFLTLLLLQQEEPKDVQAVFETTAGTFIMEFHYEQAPNHAAAFIERARQGFYDGTAFHSMVAHGVVQGGDPETRDPDARDRYGTGGLNLGLQPEISDLSFTQGTVAAMTLPGAPDGAGSQFFVCVTDQLQFTGQFTAFGRIVEGIEVVDRISTTPVDENQIASERVELTRVTIRPIPPPAAPPFSTESIEELRRHRVTMETSQGDIVMEMLPDKAPEHVRHFLRLVSLGVYDNTAFHRIAPGFVIQAGDLNTKTEPLPQAAYPYVVTIRAEISDLKHQAGVVSMARGEEIDSALTSFFIVLDDQPALDGIYTIFGQVLEGMDVVERIAAVPSEDERPTERVDVFRMRVEPN